ncbi:cyclin-dependent kinase G-2-like [Rutidosis leptorrhynchoides]|uniref:cyclin-dependent kinase G-2-like n=1 Tax=Rutidosis leptorrhynchoides TaxID=125765 RepID=UPI003A99A534
MSKYMAAGRNGGYRDNEFIERDSKGEYERVRNGGNQGYARGKDRVRDSKGGGRVRQKDNKERNMVNGGDYGSVSRSCSGGSGDDRVLRRSDHRFGVGDREPGELSSESGSDEGVDLDTRGTKNDESFKMENDSQSMLLPKKRKFSPIVWDRDDKVVSNTTVTRSSPVIVTLPPPPPLPKSYNRSPNFVHEAVIQSLPVESSRVQSLHQSPGNYMIDIRKDESFELEPDVVQEEYVGLSSSFAQEKNTGQTEIEDYVSTRTIRSSRWADADFSPDEDEHFDASADNRTQQRKESIRGSVEFGSTRKQSSSPEAGEHLREGSLSMDEDGYHVRSLSMDDFGNSDYETKDYTEINDEHNKDDDSLCQSEPDSENGDGFQGTQDPVGPPQRTVNMLLGCRSVDEFERLNKIDEGTYGVVYRAKDKKTGEVVALKKVKMEKEREGFPLTALREINILLSFHHPSIVDVKEVVVGGNLDSIFMVMEYMEHDLKALMETMKQPFSQSEVKCLMLQLLEGTKYLHDNWVLHRDLKTSNLLMNNRGELKICDFGLARQYGSPLKPYTHLVVTLWYRAPELLLGTKLYSTAIDMWSLGCIMAELLSKQPLFNGKTEFDQLDKIFKTLGTPNEAIWPGYSKLPGVKVNFVKHQYNLLRRKFPATSFTGSPVLSDAGFDLLNKLLTYDPEKRITAEAALNHDWFREVPLPKSKDFMPTFPAQHAQDRRTRRVMKSPDPLEEQRRKELHQAEFGTGGLFG